MRSNNTTFSINSPSGDKSMYVDSDGNTVVNSLVIIDSNDGSKWRISISNGELITEPLEVQVKRDWKISKILK